MGAFTTLEWAGTTVSGNVITFLTTFGVSDDVRSAGAWPLIISLRGSEGACCG